MMVKSKKILASMVVAISLLFFVKCSITGPSLPRQSSLVPDSPITSTSQPSSIRDQNAQTRDTVFPYNINIDTISYMSCPYPENRATFPPLKFASYVKGLRLTAEFEKSIQGLSYNEALRKLNQSPYVYSHAKIGITARGRPQSPLGPSGGQNLEAFFTSISHPVLREKIIRDRVLYYLTGNQRIEASLPISSREFQSYLPRIQSDSQINLTYGRGAHNQEQSPPLGPTEGQYFGRSFEMRLSDESNYIRSIEEYKLTDFSKIGRRVELP